RRLREPDEAGLRRGVIHLHGVAHRAGRRRYVDDAPAALLSDQRLAHRARHQKRAAQVHLDDAIPVFVGHAHQQLVVRHAGVVDEDVDPSKMLSRRADEPLTILAVRRVRDATQHGPPPRFPPVPGPLRPPAVAPRAPSAPPGASRCAHSAHRTGLATWRERKGRTSSAVRLTPASTFRTTGTVGSVTSAASSSGASRAPAGAINEQWNGALTGSITLIF